MNNDNRTTSLQGERRIRVDAEHFSVRFLVPVLTVGATLLTHFAGRALFKGLVEEGLSTFCVVLPLDVLVFFAVGFLSDRGLKRLMPSRRHATLSSEALVITDERHKQPQVTRLASDQTLNVKAWRFVVRRRTRVPKGWHCLAIQLVQDDQEAIFYTFISPRDAEQVPGFKHFVRLRPRKEIESSTDLAAVAHQRRLLQLENARWNDGAEISPDDFRALIAFVRQSVPEWMA